MIDFVEFPKERLQEIKEWAHQYGLAYPELSAASAIKELLTEIERLEGFRRGIIAAHEAICNEADCAAIGHYARAADLAQAAEARIAGLEALCREKDEFIR